MGEPLAGLRSDPRTPAWLDAVRFPEAVRVVCAVSGGPDSTALVLLARLSGHEVHVVHVDHGLRSDGDLEAELVAANARAVGATFERVDVTVAPGGDLENRARVERLGALPPSALFGHTADDQAETVLLALLRGAGLDGLAGMTVTRHPLLGLRRADTHAVVAASGLPTVDDPSNRDPRFRRNRVRHEVLPLLDDVAARDVAGVLARQAGMLRDEADLLDALAADIDPTCAGALRDAPAALARRAIRAWLRVDGGHPPDQASVERVLAVARGEIVATEVVGGRRVARSANRLRLEA